MGVDRGMVGVGAGTPDLSLGNYKLQFISKKLKLVRASPEKQPLWDAQADLRLCCLHATESRYIRNGVNKANPDRMS